MHADWNGRNEVGGVSPGTEWHWLLYFDIKRAMHANPAIASHMRRVPGHSQPRAEKPLYTGSEHGLLPEVREKSVEYTQPDQPARCPH